MDWSYTGRKYTIFIGHFMAGVSLIFLLFLNETYFIICITSAKLFITLAFTSTITYTSEVYNSDIRVIGMGMSNFFCRLAGVIMPSVGIGLYEATQNRIVPFIPFIILVLISSLFDLM